MDRAVLNPMDRRVLRLIWREVLAREVPPRRDPNRTVRLAVVATAQSRCAVAVQVLHIVEGAVLRRLAVAVVALQKMPAVAVVALLRVVVAVALLHAVAAVAQLHAVAVVAQLHAVAVAAQLAVSRIDRDLVVLVVIGHDQVHRYHKLPALLLDPDLAHPGHAQGHGHLGLAQDQLGHAQGHPGQGLVHRGQGQVPQDHDQDLHDLVLVHKGHDQGQGQGQGRDPVGQGQDLQGQGQGQDPGRDHPGLGRDLPGQGQDPQDQDQDPDHALIAPLLADVCFLTVKMNHRWRTAGKGTHNTDLTHWGRDKMAVIFKKMHWSELSPSFHLLCPKTN